METKLEEIARDLAAVKQKVDQHLLGRVAVLEEKMDANTKVTEQTALTVTVIRDILTSFRILAVVAKYLGLFAAAVSTMIAALAAAYHGWKYP